MLMESAGQRTVARLQSGESIYKEIQVGRVCESESKNMCQRG